MLYLLAATIASSLLVIILKMIGMRGGNVTAAITINYIVGAAITFALSPTGVDWAHIAEAPWLPMSIVVGISFMVSLVVYALSAERSGVAITTISGRAAMAVPVIFAFAVLGEKPTALKIVLLAAIFLSLWLILKKDKPQSPQSATPRGFLATAWLPLLVFTLNGMNDTMMQFTKREYIGDSSDNMVYTGTMFVASALTGLIFYLFQNRGRLPLPSLRTTLWGTLLGVVNAICCIGILYALESMDGSVFYPLYYAGAVVISTVVGVWAFREKLSLVNYIGIIIALAAIILLAAL